VGGWTLALIGVIGAQLHVDFVAAVLGELSVHRQWRRAAGVGVAAWIGFLIGTVVKVGLAFAMIAILIAALFWR